MCVRVCVYSACLCPLVPGILPHTDNHEPHSYPALHTLCSGANTEGICSSEAKYSIPNETYCVSLIKHNAVPVL